MAYWICESLWLILNTTCSISTNTKSAIFREHLLYLLWLWISCYSWESHRYIPQLRHDLHYFSRVSHSLIAEVADIDRNAEYVDECSISPRCNSTHERRHELLWWQALSISRTVVLQKLHKLKEDTLENRFSVRLKHVFGCVLEMLTSICIQSDFPVKELYPQTSEVNWMFAGNASCSPRSEW